jgi:hypothetical protein
MWSRRRVLTAGGLGALGALGPRAVRAAPFGAAPDAVGASALLGENIRAEQVLELFLFGGLSPWETFYTVPDYGRPTDPSYPNEQSHLFEGSWPTIADRCGLSASWLEPEPFALDADGVMVHLGPFVGPIRARPDLVARMRIIVHHHTLEPHEAAVPLMLTGMRLGSPRMAGGAASVQRYFSALDGLSSPRAYTLYPEFQIETANMRAASAVGLHPGSARPLELRVGSTNDIPAMLSRTVGADQCSALDALVQHYSRRADTRYAGLRTSALRDHLAAATLLEDTEGLSAILTEEAMANVNGESCGVEDSSQPATALQIARHLLTHPTDPARMVTLIDGGLKPSSGGGGYDVHTDHIGDTATNLTHTLRTLVECINEPGEADPTKIDIDRTMIAFTTEFGRTPFRQRGSGNGTNHHPYGYVSVLIGGPIGPDQAGVVGSIGPDGTARTYVSPVELRAAMLGAMGIWPFAPEAFTLGDLRLDRGHNADGVAWLNEIVLGRPV